MSEKKIANDFDWENNTWEVIDTFFKQDSVLINHHLTSFNYFMEKDIQAIVREKEFSTVKVYNKDKYDEEKELYKEVYEIEFGKIYISKPVLYDKPNKYMYPDDARLRKLTYGGNICLDIHHRTITIRENGEKVIENHPTLEKFPCGRMPIMVGSKFCVLNNQSTMTKCEMGEGMWDDGGYFIVKGSEKVIISQEKVAENKICCFPEKTSQSKFSDKAEIWSVEPNNPSVVSKIIVRMKATKDDQTGNVIRIRMKRFKQDIPIVILFRALNYISDKSIVELIVYNTSKDLNFDMIDLLNSSIDEAKQINSQKLALEYISKYLNGIQVNKYKTNKCKLKYTFETIVNDLFPHVGTSPIKKAYFLGHMVNKMLKCHINGVYDDRDSFINKRVETSGELMSQLFRAYFGRFNKELKMECDKDMLAGRMSELPQNLSKKLKPNAIERDINYCIGTGTWGLKNKNPRKGIAAVLQRLSYLQTLSSLRRVVSQFDKTGNGKLTEPRKLHCTQWGVICPFETPEGGSIGIVKNMALTSSITIPCSSDTVISCLEENDVIPLEEVNPLDIYDSVKVFVNGDWFGQSMKPNELVTKLKKYRREGIINPYISISWNIDIGEIQIWSDGGRMCRPLYIVENNQLNISDEYIALMKKNNYQWKNLLHNHSNELEKPELNKSILEYVDVIESDTLMIAMNKEQLDENSTSNYAYYNYTHCEIHASLILGVLASNIPFADHNQAPRNLFQGAMGKQAMGIYSTAFRHRMDTMAHILHYPQKPIVNTENSKYVHSDTLPSGQMPIVAIACYTGYNQEDSLIFNQSSIDRGLFSSSFYRTYVDEEKKNSATLEDEKFCKPQKFYPNGKIYTEKMSYGSYDKLDENGLVRIGDYVDGNDIIIGKVTMLKDSIEGEPKARDLSTSLRMNESGIVDKIYKNSNGDGYNFVKVRVRSDRIPEIGDKFCHDEETEILTNNGWKYFKDLNYIDKVATLVDGEELIYENPTEIVNFDCNEEIYKIQSNQVDLAVTLNHRMYVANRNKDDYKIEYAKDIINKRKKYLKNIKKYNKNNNENYFILPKVDNYEEKKINMDAFLTIFGIWIAEGWLDGSKSICFATHKKRVKESLEENFKILNYEIIKKNDKKNSNELNKWIINDKQLFNVFKDINKGSIHKYLPNWVWKLNMEQSKLLMNSMIKGDGHYMKNGTLRYDTSSTQLADDFQKLALHAGYSANLYIKYKKGHESYSKTRNEVFRQTVDAYRLTVITKQNNPLVNKNMKKDKSNAQDNLIHYNGKVYCCSVPSGIVYVRRNGKPVWTGNSSRH